MFFLPSVFSLLAAVHNGLQCPEYTLAKHPVHSPRSLQWTVLFAPHNDTQLAPTVCNPSTAQWCGCPALSHCCSPQWQATPCTHTSEPSCVSPPMTHNLPRVLPPHCSLMWLSCLISSSMSTMACDVLHSWIVVQVPSKSLLQGHCHTCLHAPVGHVPVCVVFWCFSRHRTQWQMTPCVGTQGSG